MFSLLKISSSEVLPTIRYTIYGFGVMVAMVAIYKYRYFRNKMK